jgi:hypothetical protein
MRPSVVALFVALFFSPASARADVVLQWNEVLIATIPAPNPFAGTRVAAITHLAMFEAVNAILTFALPRTGIKLEYFVGVVGTVCKKVKNGKIKVRCCLNKRREINKASVEKWW